MRHVLKIFGILSILALASCSSINAGLKADPIANSEFADNALREVGEAAEAIPENIYPFHRVWRTKGEALNEGEALRKDEGVSVFVAPVGISALFEESKSSHEIQASDAQALAQYFKNQLQRELRLAGFQVVDERPLFGRIIELAFVEVSSTDVIRNVLGTAVGTFVPGGGILSISSSGRTAIEGVVRDATTQRPLFIFADRERGKIALFSFNDFTRHSHARAAIDDWAEQIVKACSTPLGTRIADSSVITLMPL